MNNLNNSNETNIPQELFVLSKAVLSFLEQAETMWLDTKNKEDANHTV